jgi:two-component system response regulator RegA
LAQTRPPSVLLVDGERGAREALARQFIDSGWSVATADGWAQALRSAVVAVPDCLVVDQTLSDGSGFGLFDRLRALNPELSAVMVTRQPSIAEAVRAIRAGFCDYRSKSLDCSRLPDIFGYDLGEGSRPANDPGGDMGSLARVEWDHIQTVLLQARGNVSEAARVLGLHRRSLQRKLRRAPDERPCSRAAKTRGRGGVSGGEA